MSVQCDMTWGYVCVCVSMQDDLSQYAMDSEKQQDAVLAIADEDAFNWGYDPVHYMAPEGSYATDPDGSARVVEFRQMVQSLHAAGLKVVLDVVYNHTYAAGITQWVPTVCLAADQEETDATEALHDFAKCNPHATLTRLLKF